MIFTLSTKGFNDVIDITDRISKIVKSSKIQSGICLISSPGSTCGITTLEYESGLIEDLKRILDEIIPMSTEYEHCKKWGDCNGYDHLRSALIKPFLNVPIERGKLLLGRWQQIIFIDFDNRPRQREIIVKIINE